MSYVLVLAQSVLAAVFAWSAVGKAAGRARFADFRDELAGMGLLPRAAVTPVAAAVVAAEAAVPPLLVWPGARGAGLLVALALLTAFAGAIAVVLARGTVASCRCFGGSPAPFGRRHLVRNGVLAAVAVGGLVAVGRGGGGPVHPAGVAVTVLAGAVVVAAVVFADDLADLVSGTRPAPPRVTRPPARARARGGR